MKILYKLVQLKRDGTSLTRFCVVVPTSDLLSPSECRGFFKEFPFVDILVHGEGEYIIENIFKVFLEDKDWSKVKGISTKLFRTTSQERINNLTDLPSPYLTNLIWDLVDKNSEVDWDTSWETNRGCPYQCTFCDWGSATFTKIRKVVIYVMQ